MKYFKIIWRDGNVTYIRGTNIDTALSYNGINGTLSASVESVEECQEIPRNKKQIIIMDTDNQKEYLSGKLTFIQRVRDELQDGQQHIKLSVNNFQCKYEVDETPYEFVLRKVYD